MSCTRTTVSNRKTKRQATHALSFNGSAIVEGGVLDITDWSKFFIHIKVASRDVNVIRRIFSIRHSGGDDIRILTDASSNGFWQFAVDDGVSYSATSSRKIIYGEKVDIIATFDGSTLRLYTDGVLTGIKTGASFNFATAAGELALGGISASPSWDGDMELVQVANVTLTDQEALDLAKNNVLPRDTVLAIEYFNSIETDGAGSVLANSASDIGANDGTSSGATWLPLEQTKALPSRVEHVLRLDGVDATRVTLPTLPAMTKFTYSGWVQQNVSAGSVGVLSSTSGGQNNFNLFVGDKDGGVGIIFQYRNAVSSTLTDNCGYVAPYKVPIFITFVYDGVDFRIYANGTLRSVTSSASTLGITFRSIAYTLGYDIWNSSAPRTIEGNLWDSKLTPYAYTAQEALDLYKHSICPKDKPPVGNWNEISDDGLTLIDNSGNENDGAIIGAVSVEGRTAKKQRVPYVGSLLLKSSSDYVTITNDQDKLYFNNDLITIRQKFMVHDNTILYRTVMNSTSILIRSISTGAVEFILNSFTSNDRISGGHVLQNVWHEVIGVFDGTYIRLYLDGKLVGITEPTGTYVGSTADWLISNSGSEAFNGNVALTQILKGVALTTAEIEAVYITDIMPYVDNKDICIVNLEAKTDLLSGSLWRDQTENHNDGAITGATLSAEAPSKAKNTDRCNLVPNGGFNIRPYTVAATTINNRIIEGTAAGGGVHVGGNGEMRLFKWKLQAYNVTNPSGEYVYDDELKKYVLKLSGTEIKERVHVVSAFRIYPDLNDPVDIKNNTIPVKANTSYKASIWVKTDISNVVGSAQEVKVVLYGHNPTAYSAAYTIMNNVRETIGWTKYELEFTTGATITNLNPYMGINGNSSNYMDAIVRFSEFRLEEV